MSETRLEVWGDPIAHSRSPQLHLAASRLLGRDWSFERRRVTAGTVCDELADAVRRGIHALAVTMPLKEEAYAATAAGRSAHAEATGAVNTVLLSPDGAHRGWNTDVGGIMRALTEAGLQDARSVRILGAGATAASALVAVADLGIAEVEVRARRPERARALAGSPAARGREVVALGFEQPCAPVDLTIATLPGGASLDPDQVDRLAQAGGALFDVAYSPWPSALASGWTPGESHSGIGMLLHQAVLQVRLFSGGDEPAPLADEDRLVATMRAAVMKD